MQRFLQVACWALLSVLLLQASPAEARCLDRQAPVATPRGTLSPLLLGVNLLFFQATDNVRHKAQFLNSLESIPIDSLRFPGGTVSDNYLWREKRTARADWYPWNHKSSANDLDFDELMSVAKCIGAQPTIVLNLRTWLADGNLEKGIQEAEDWVKYANVEKRFGIRYWELGNEVYGGRKQRQTPLTSEEYGRYYAMFRSRLKAIDPSIKLGLVMPSWIGFRARGDGRPWWNGAIKGAGGEVDYIIVHKYVAPTLEQLLHEGSTLDRILARINRRMIRLLGHPIPIHLTEWNLKPKWWRWPGTVRYNTIGDALFTADALLDAAEGGVELATLWPLIGFYHHGQGLLNQENLSLNAPGRTLQLLAPIAGWRIVQKESRPRPGLQTTVLAAGIGRDRAVVAINWSISDIPVDWASMVGGCSATVETLRPSNPATSPQSLDDGVDEDAPAKISAPFNLPGLSVAVIRTDTAGCN